MSAENRKESKVEVIKREGNHLRGTIREALVDERSHFEEENIQQLKFHGVYQQDHRDLRAQLRKEGREKHYMMMIRARIPGGILSPDQYLKFDDLSEQYGNQTMRITTRQTFQLHGILKENLKQTIQGIHHSLLTTLGGCGDQVRNIIACANPIKDNLHAEIHADLLQLVDKLAAKTNAFHEIWLDGEPVRFDMPEEEEPLYKDVYLPRKFKIGFTVEGDNCCDVYANDIGIVAHPNGDSVAGYTLLVGGGMGRTVSQKDTYPRLATPLTFVTREELVATCVEIVKIQRDYGNREERRYARFKYTLDQKGMPWFKQELATRLGRSLMPPKKLVWTSATDHLGWHHEGNDQYYLGLFIENGRIADWPHLRLKTVLREIVRLYQPTIQLTSQQNLILCQLSLQDKESIEQKLSLAGVKLVEEISSTKRHSMACPAMPTCGLATAESERALPSVLAEFESMFAELGLSEESISIRMTGCANGCARPYIAEIGLVGRTPGKYDLFLASDFYGARLNELYREMVPISEFTQILRPLLAAFKENRKADERFGEYCHRVGFDYLQSLEQIAVRVK